MPEKHPKFAILFPFLALGIFGVIIGCGGGGTTPATSVTTNTTGSTNSGSSTGSTTGSTTGSPPGSCGVNFATPNYATETEPGMAQNDLTYWPNWPVTYTVQNDPTWTINGQTVTGSSLVAAAFQEWTNASGGKALFQQASNPSNAQITIGFTTLAARPGGNQSLGFASVDARGTAIFAANININIWPNMTDDEVVKGTLLSIKHEIGHAIYLNGHSNDVMDVMFPSRDLDENKNLTQRDINTFLTSYCGTFPSRQKSIDPILQNIPVTTTTFNCPSHPDQP